MSQNTLIRSTLFDDYEPDDHPQVIVILQKFLTQWLPDMQKNIRRSLDQKEWLLLAKDIHAVKGTAGGYGFPMLTDLAVNIEDSLKLENYGNIPRLIDDFDEICRRIYVDNS